MSAFIEVISLNNLFVLVTNRCNLTCRHCYVSSSPNGEHGLSAEIIFDLAVQFHRMFGRQRLTLSGGEFFTRRDLLFELEALAGLHDLFILTNGMLINKRIADIVKPLPTAFRFGFDGVHRRTHDRMRGEGAYNRALNGLETLLREGISPSRIEIFFTATNENCHEISKALSFAEQYDIQRLVIEPVAVHGRATQGWVKTVPSGHDEFRQVFGSVIDQLSQQELAERWSWRPPKVNFRTLTVYFDGRVFPFTPADKLDETLGLLGSIHSSSLAEILNPELYWAKALGKAMRHYRSASTTTGPYRFWRKNCKDEIIYA
jgi:molybdenum cofactor biosynthesis enzyme MoaA